MLQIIIEGVTGNSYTGDIAIDEISFVTGSCRGGLVPTDDEEESEKNGNGEISFSNTFQFQVQHFLDNLIHCDSRGPAHSLVCYIAHGELPPRLQIVKT